MDFEELQRHWDAFGHIDPLWAILTDPRRRGNRWDTAEFFATGREEIASVLDHAQRLQRPRSRRRALDFGCGAGRLTQALAAYVDEAIGVDVAASMIALAQRHNAFPARCRYEVNDSPDLARFADAFFDIVYTGRVLQHMEPRYAECYIRDFVRVLSPGGYLSFDVPSEYGFFPAAGLTTVEGSAYRADILLHTVPPILSPGQRLRVGVDVFNTSAHTWTNEQLNVGNHWATDDLRGSIRDDARSAVTLPWPPGGRQYIELEVRVPAVSGSYRLQCDLVHEGVTWFEDAGSAVAETSVIVGHKSNDAVPQADPGASADEEPRMEMHAIPRQRVEEILVESGATLLEARRVDHCGPRWLAFRYDVTK